MSLRNNVISNTRSVERKKFIEKHGDLLVQNMHSTLSF